VKTLVFEEEHLICYLDHNIPILYHKWLRKPTGQEFRDGLKRIQKEYVKLKDKYPNLFWIANTELLSELSEDEEQWLIEEWDHLLFDDAGVKVHAVVLGDDLYADYPMEKFKLSSDRKFKEKNISLGIFPNEEAAYDWLQSQSEEQAN